jgi:hypothetical protein
MDGKALATRTERGSGEGMGGRSMLAFPMPPESLSKRLPRNTAWENAYPAGGLVPGQNKSRLAPLCLDFAIPHPHD